MITRGTTPTLTFNLRFDLSTVQEICISFSQNERTKIEKTLSDLTVDRPHGIIVLRLSEDDTYELEADILCHIRIRLDFYDGTILYSKDMSTDVENGEACGC